NTPFELKVEEIQNSGPHKGHFDPQGLWLRGLAGLRWSPPVIRAQDNSTSFADGYKGQTDGSGKAKLTFKAGLVSFDFHISAATTNLSPNVTSAKTQMSIGLTNLQPLTGSLFQFDIGSH